MSTPLQPFVLVFAALTTMALAQEGVPAPPGLVPEQMWPAPTAEDWARPVPIQWQRTWDDAVRLSQATKKPILVCVNMDGEIASEHYAGIRYRDPEVTKLFEPYVCVIASVYRHNPRDYDDQGRRIECPRLGCVTCGEHIAMEPIVYEKFLDGKRISPRHIMVELDGSETYDVFYTWDVKSVLDSLDNGIKNRAIQPEPIVKGDRSLLEKVQSPDAADRAEVEQTYLAADPEQKTALLDAALELGDRAPVELLRLAAYGLDPAQAKKAREGMTKATDPGTVDLIADTLRGQLPKTERTALVDALDKFAGDSTRARTLATAHRGLAGQQSAIDPTKWQSVLEGAAYTGAYSSGEIAAAATARDRALAENPEDPNARLDVAESSLLQALADHDAGVGPGAARQAAQFRRMQFLDADRAARAAGEAGATGWRVAAIRAVASLHLGQPRRAYDLAVEAAPNLPPDAPGRLAMEVLALFAEARQEAIVQAVRNKEKWPPQWMTDVHAAYAVLDRHPLGRPVHVANHYDFLEFFGTPQADEVLDRGLERFPAAPELHQRLRARALKRGGADGLEAEYAARLASGDANATMPWFAGYASLVAAEAHRARNRGEAAIAAYERAIAHFQTYVERSPEGAANGSHYVAMAHAGIAAVRLRGGDLQGAFDALVAGFAANPAATSAVDGLSRTAMQTAEQLRARATEAKDEALVAKLDAELKKLPDEAYVLPEYEQASRGGQRMGRRR
ncbi:MAG: hypothetical protein KDE27_01210 [Planctomycetes bacterium]|nr:hypothetical protein [Planctomycetota bacterium]